MQVTDEVTKAMIDALTAWHDKGEMPTYRELYRYLRKYTKAEVDHAWRDLRTHNQVAWRHRQHKSRGRKPSPFVYLINRWEVLGEPLDLIYLPNGTPWDHNGEMMIQDLWGEVDAQAPPETDDRELPPSPTQDVPVTQVAVAAATEEQEAETVKKISSLQKTSPDSGQTTPEPEPEQESQEQTPKQVLQELVKHHIQEHGFGPTQEWLISRLSQIKNLQEAEAKREFLNLAALTREAYKEGGLRRLGPNTPHNPTEQPRLVLRTAAQAEDDDTADYHAARAAEIIRQAKERAEENA